MAIARTKSSGIFDSYLELVIGNFNALGGKALHDLTQNVALEASRTVFGVHYPEAGLENYAACCQFRNDNPRFAGFENAGLLLDRRGKDFERPVDVALVGAGDVKSDCAFAFGQRIVRHRSRDEILVGNDELLTGRIPDDGIAGVDLRDDAGEARNLHKVAEFDRTVKENDEARDVVGGDLLHAEADAHADGAAEDGKNREVDADA